ncbi:MAG TPA: hypothetical protein VKB50_03185, partial [Vicinamibacterales bacterium]|nr:hypothetical protein [Vicinamibacterales bacterium]
MTPDSAEVQRVLGELNSFGPILAVKLYRLTLAPSAAVPVLPCLDHEAMLHEIIAPHAAAYVQEASSGELHELVFVPASRRIEIDSVSTWGECTPDSRDRLLAMVAKTYPDYRVRVSRPSWWRGERRVASACRAQVSLREVLLGADMAAVKTRIDRLQTIATLMEKQSRVASWGIRTVTSPLLAFAGVLLFMLLGYLTTLLGESGVTALRYVL